MKSKTFALFIAAALLELAGFLTTLLWNGQTMGSKHFLVGVMVTISFGLSVAGIIVGLGEIKTRKRFIGLVGNCLMVAMYLAIIVYGISLKR